jgi:hypothetical protein
MMKRDTMREAGGRAALTRMSLLMLWTGVAVSALGIGATGCSYDPRIADGTLRCSSSGACPDNYSCSLGTCVSVKADAGRITPDATVDHGGTGDRGTITPDGSSPDLGGPPDAGTGTADATVDRGGAGNAPLALVNRFVGTWILAPTSTVTTRCADSATPIVTMLSPPTDPSRMIITAGMPGQYDLDCAWLHPSLHLRLDDTGAHLFDDRPYSAKGDGDVETQTWTATQFDILANTGTTAMFVAAYTRVDQYTQASGGKKVVCMQMVNAPVTKQ